MDLTDPQQWNGYAYSSNPTTYSDPSGLIYCGSSTCAESFQMNHETGKGTITSTDYKTGKSTKRTFDVRRTVSPPVKAKGQSANRCSYAGGYQCSRGQSPGMAGKNHKNLLQAQRWLDRKVPLISGVTGNADAVACYDGKRSGCAWTVAGLAAGPVRKALKLGDLALGAARSGDEAAGIVGGGVAAGRVATFVDGDILVREFAAGEKQLETAAEVRIVGDVRHLDDLGVFAVSGHGLNRVPVGTDALGSVKEEILRLAREQGFSRVELSCTRFYEDGDVGRPGSLRFEVGQG